MKAKLYAYVVVNAALIAALIALPVKTVAAKEPHKASTRDELEIAVESAKPGDVIEITADIPMTHCLFIKGKSLTIRSGKEGGVHSLKRTEQYFGQLIKIEQSNVIFEDIIIDGNKNGAGERTEYLLSALDSGITLLSGAVLQNNSGAGVRAENCEFMLDGGTVKNNLGGLWLDDSNFTMKDGEIVRNESMHNYGGGVYLRYGDLVLSGGEIRENSSEHSGGGIAIESGSGVMSGGSIFGNTSFFGGGVSVRDGTFIMTGGTISENAGGMAGGGIECRTVFGSAAFIMRGGSISSNTSEGGGGLAIFNDAEFSLSGGSIDKNEAEVGGGVLLCGYDSGGRYLMTGGEIADNEAAGEGPSGFYDNTVKGAGGGIYQAGERSVFELKDGSVLNNKANSGAGVYIEAGTFEMSGGTVTGNTARISHGGVYDRTGGFEQSGGTVDSNIDHIDLAPIDENSVLESIDIGSDTGIIKIEESREYKELLAAHVLNDNEKKSAAFGDPVTVYLSADILAPLEEERDRDKKFAKEKEFALIDVKMSVNTPNDGERDVLKANGAIPVTIFLPEELRNEGGSLALVNAGGGETIYYDIDDDPATFTFKTDVFSSFVLIDGGAEKKSEWVAKPPSAGPVSAAGQDPEKIWVLPSCIALLGILLSVVCFSAFQLRKLR
ncbi:MAG: hypothetical protein BWY11_01712 [Firmicutes bacterium ADurb.Bin182]|nr:MAG: hypothetical protein BWY11_01712 [Firmicutes bacterium ADurb.Bin182]